MSDPAPTLSLPSLEQILEIVEFTNCTKEDVLFVAVYGSHVYGLATADSDVDICLIISDRGIEMMKQKMNLKETREYNHQVNDGSVDVTIYSQSLFENLAKSYNLGVMEYISMMQDDSNTRSFIISQSNTFETSPFLFEPSNSEKGVLLRRSISAEADHSFVKAKNKIIKENNIKKGLKALFHSIRTVIFGMQIAKYGMITDFTEANPYWAQILEFYESRIQQAADSALPERTQTETWEMLKNHFKPQLNKLQTEFRKLLV